MQRRTRWRNLRYGTQAARLYEKCQRSESELMIIVFAKKDCREEGSGEMGEGLGRLARACKGFCDNLSVSRPLGGLGRP